MKTTQFALTIGVNPGYGHDNQQTPDIIGPVWQEEAAKVFDETMIYVGAAITSGVTVYHTAWGCPFGGERTAVVSGLRNPQFTKDDDAWRKAVQKVCGAVGKRFEQKALYLTFSEVDFEYMLSE